MRKKLLLLGALLLTAALVLGGCAAPEPAEEPTPSPTPTEAPTPFVPTPEPTITARPVEGAVETPEPDKTAMLIDPIDKPTHPPIVFEPYDVYTSVLGYKVDVPSYFLKPPNDPQDELLRVFEEPQNDIRSGEVVPAYLSVQVHNGSTAQTEDDAKAELTRQLEEFKELYPSLRHTDQAYNAMLDEKGTYVTYWYDEVKDPNGDPEDTLNMRGRWLVVPKGNRLYVVRYACPSELNGMYENGLYKQVRATFEEV